MNDQMMRLAKEAGFLDGDLELFPETIERFAELVRQDERDKCAQDYLQDCCNAVDAARLEEREACVKLLDDFAKTGMVPAKDTWRMGLIAGANALRARGNHEQTR